MLQVVEFKVVGIPESWSNNGIWSRQAAIAQHKKKSFWTDKVIYLGQVHRTKSGWQSATYGHSQRLVTIRQYRYGILDDDNLFASVKPLLDGLKSFIRRRGKVTAGAGLIWNDNPRHCRLAVEQTRIAYPNPGYVFITVERNEAGLE